MKLKKNIKMKIKMKIKKKIKVFYNKVFQLKNIINKYI